MEQTKHNTGIVTMYFLKSVWAQILFPVPFEKPSWNRQTTTSGPPVCTFQKVCSLFKKCMDSLSLPIKRLDLLINGLILEDVEI